MSVFTTKFDRTLDIRRLVRLSSAHLTLATQTYLKYEAYANSGYDPEERGHMSCGAFPDGFFVYCVDAKPEWCVRDLHVCMVWARREHGADYIHFDDHCIPIDELPVMDEPVLTNKAVRGHASD
jgi:hypothetical protein